MKIAVACCAKLQQINPQPVWQEIMNENPDIMLLVGDTIYLDSNHHSDPTPLQQELRTLYQMQFAEPYFKALLAQLVAQEKRIIAIYDDHDFLGDNRYGADHDPILREVARREFIETFSPFGIQIPQAPDVYQVVRASPVDIIVLDERFYRSAPSNSHSDHDAILGARQWQWLERVFLDSVMPFILVVSSTTLHRIGNESWMQYPAAYARLCALMRGRPGAFVVSGDVHDNYLEDDSGVIEIITSGCARKSLFAGRILKNYAILTFTGNQLRAELRSIQAGSRFDITLDRGHWSLDAATDSPYTGLSAEPPFNALGDGVLAGHAELLPGETVPNRPENSVCGPIRKKITRTDPEFATLVKNTNGSIVFKDEEGTGADRMMTQHLCDGLGRLATLVSQEWADCKLRVTEAWDEDNEHTGASLHYEGRAADLTTDPPDGAKLGRLARLAVDVGLDWVWFENEAHVHVSVK